MKNILVLTITLLSLTAAKAGTTEQCGKEFGQSVALCTQSIDTQSVDPKLRSEVHKACIADAKAAKVTCLAGVNQCFVTCDTAHATAVSTCNSTYNPLDCAGDVICEQIVTQQRIDCTNQADATRTSCKASCSL